MRRIFALLDTLTFATASVGAVAMVVLMLHVAVEVALRALGTAPVGTIIFVSNYYMALIVCLPLALVERTNAHIQVDVLTSKLPSGVQRHLMGWTLLVSAIVFGVVTYASWIEAVAQYRLDKFEIEGGIRFSVWYGYFALPIGYGLAAFYMVLKFLAYLLGQPLDEPAAITKPEQEMYD